MKSFIKKLLAAALTVALVASSMTIPSFASTKYKYVTPSITIKSKVAAGEEVSNNSIKYDYESADTGEIHIGISDSALYDIDEVEFVSSDDHIVKIGEQIKIKVTLVAEDDSSTDKTTRFNSSCKVSGAESTGYSRSSNCESCTITLKLKAADGEYEEPEIAEWGTSRGFAKWTPADENTSGYYEVTLIRGSSSVTTVIVHGTSYNFYFKDWMGKKGTYSFKVRTIPDPNSSSGKSSQKSDWTYSDELELDATEVATVAGKGDDGMGGGSSSTTNVGWQLVSGNWYYRFPDGSPKKNGWEKIGGKWYLFDASGVMLTGWQNSGGKTYYLDATNGDMKTGWVTTASGDWYYLNPNIGGPEGAMLQDSWLDYNGNRYYLGSSGAMITGWYQVGGKYYYFNPATGGPKGAMVRNARIESFYVDATGAWVPGV